MHANATLLNRLFAALDRHDHAAMAACYHPAATFRDIAFDLHSSKEIHCMWHMICEGDIRAGFEVSHADDCVGQARLVATYTFGAGRSSRCAGRPVRNIIDSRFRLEGGLIVEHQDTCDAREWARAALGGAAGFLAGRIRFLRSLKAREKLQAFIGRHPEYR